MNENLSCVVSGSFKYKPEIDLAIEELEEHGVMVLAPEKGWLLLPSHKLLTFKEGSFRPLPSEVGMDPGEVEDEFLRALVRSDFVYVVAEEGYVGEMVCFELGVALATGKPVYLSEPVKWEVDMDPNWIKMMKVMGVKEAVLDVSNHIFK